MSQSNEDRNKELRSILIELRDEIVSRIEQEMGSKVGEDPRISSLSPMDSGELSQLDLDEDIDYTLLNMHIVRLREVEDALDRLEEGTYGICEDCGAAIKLERLKALPFTTCCVRCQEKREQLGQESRLKQMRRGEDVEPS